MPKLEGDFRAQCTALHGEVSHVCVRDIERCEVWQVIRRAWDAGYEWGREDEANDVEADRRVSVESEVVAALEAAARALVLSPLTDEYELVINALAAVRADSP